MTDERYNEIMSNDSIKLTLRELSDGWHFCWAMDGLLANYKEKDGDCYCYLNKSRRKQKK